MTNLKNLAQDKVWWWAAVNTSRTFWLIKAGNFLTYEYLYRCSDWLLFRGHGGVDASWCEGKHCVLTATRLLSVSKISTVTESMNALPDNYMFVKQI
jgi:hypothetical protein